jgi:hypothetical protein
MPKSILPSSHRRSDLIEQRGIAIPERLETALRDAWVFIFR